MKFCLFRENMSLLGQPSYDVRSHVSLDSFRLFVNAIRGTKPDITDDNTKDLGLLCDEFKFTPLSSAVADWREAHTSLDGGSILTKAALDEQLQSQDRTICLLDHKPLRYDRLQQAIG
jgi:hypothetical protein